MYCVIMSRACARVLMPVGMGRVMLYSDIVGWIKLEFDVVFMEEKF